MNSAQVFLIVLGRIFLSIIFILSGVNKILDWQIMEQSVISTFQDWQVYLSQWKGVSEFFETLIAWGPFLLGIAAFLEIVGGLMILLGIKVRWGAFFLFLFLVPTTILYHHFWFLDGHKRDLETITFLKNLAVIGSLMILWAFGPIYKKPSMRHDSKQSS